MADQAKEQMGAGVAKVTKEQACWCLILGLSPAGTLINGIIAGNTGDALTPFVKTSVLQMLLTPLFGIGALWALCTGCKTYSNSK